MNKRYVGVITNLRRANSTLYSRYILKMEKLDLKTTLIDLPFFLFFQRIEKYTNRSLSREEMQRTAKSLYAYLML